MWQACKLKLLWAWRHRTKCLGLAAVGVAYVQNHLASLGSLISTDFQGVLLAGFGVAAFVIGLYNSLHENSVP